MSDQQPPSWLGLMPAVFVLLWATGFIGAKFGLPYAEPFTFLAYRFWIVVALFAVIVLASGAPRPRTWRQTGHNVVVGVLLHGIYLGGVFAAIWFGMSAGLSALIVGLQPALTALVARPLFGERIAAVQWIGIVAGFAGLALVVARNVDFAATGDLAAGGGWPALALCMAGLVGITAGSIYQKAFCRDQDLRTGALLQYIGGAAVVTVVALAFETGEVRWTAEFLFAMAWLVLVLSLGAVSLLMIIIRHGEISRVAGMFYLVPPVTAVIAWLLFDERLGVIEIAGIALAALGTMLVTRGGARVAKSRAGA